MRLLKELFHAAVETHRPGIVVVDGEAGIGKSRLVWEFDKYVDRLSDATSWHRGRCLSYGDGVAFWALAEAARTRLGLTEADAGDIVRTRLDEALAEHIPDPEERSWIRPRLAALVGAEATSDFERGELFAAWTARGRGRPSSGCGRSRRLRCRGPGRTGEGGSSPVAG